MIDNNLPDDCQGKGENLPWNEPEAVECPKCNSTMTSDDCGDLICDDEFNEWCDHVIYAPDEDDF
jgi:hypothetical protein